MAELVASESQTLLLALKSLRSLPLRRILASMVPIIYVWSLPALAHLRIYRSVNDGDDWVTFAHRCHGYPTCNDSLIGVSVANFIQTPQATGALAATFFFPLMHLWRPEAVVENDDVVFFTLVFFQMSFGMLISLSPIFNHYALRELMQLIFCVAAIVHFRRMLRHCHSHRYAICRLLMIGLIGAEVVAVTLILIALCLTDYDSGYRIWGSWIYFVFDAFGLSAIALFPLLWQRDRDLCLRERITPSFPIGTSYYSMGNSTYSLKVAGTVCPILFVWLLPVFASSRLFVYRCRDFPFCVEHHEEAAGESVSNMICTPEATGALAACFFWPCMHFWMPGKQAPQSAIAYAFLVVFQIFFGCFLSCPVIYLPMLHSAVVGIFAASCIAHLSLLMYNCLKARLCQCVACLVVAVSMLIALFGLSAVRLVDVDFYRRGTFVAWCFYLCEAVGLSAIASFPLAWRRADGEANLRSNSCREGDPRLTEEEGIRHRGFSVSFVS